MKSDAERTSTRPNIGSILAATDFSVDSRHAAHRAAMLAVTIGIERGLLLHVVEESWMDVLTQFTAASGEARQKIIDEAFHTLVHLAREVRKQSGYALQPQVRGGNTLNEIIGAASEFDLLVLGAHGLHPVRALALGTTSQRLLSKVRQPVLIVKRKPRTEYKIVLVAVDFSPNAAKALLYTRILAPNAVTSLVHALYPLAEGTLIYAGASDKAIEEFRIKARMEAEEKMTGFIKAVGMESFNLLRQIEYGRAPGKLLDMIHKWNPDLVVVGKHGGLRIEEVLLGSVTLHVLAHSQCDVLVAE